MTWAAAGGGAMTLIGTTVASDDATIGVDGLDSTYDTYCIAISDLKPASDNVHLRLRLGDSGGIDSGSGDYQYHRSNCHSGTTNYDAGASAGESYLQVISSVGNDTGEGCGAVGWLHCPNDGGMKPTVSGTVSSNEMSGLSHGGHWFGRRGAVIAVTQVEVSFTSGNITSGRLTVWGLAHA